MALAYSQRITPAHHAGRILAAWTAGDEALLQNELQKSHSLDCIPLHGLDEERLELLMAASEGILRTPQPILQAKKDPTLRRCLDLLAHLAQAPC